MSMTRIVPLPDGISKICANCKQIKSLDDFGTENRNSDHKMSWCRECMNARKKQWYQDNIEQERERARKRSDTDERRAYMVQWNKEHKDKVLEYIKKPKARFLNAKRLAKYRKLVWNISMDIYIDLISKPCYYCGDKLSEIGISLDRIDSDPKIGYILENVVSCCAICNFMKQELGIGVFKNQIIKIAKNLELL